jgi:hypothetical protein
MATFEELYGAWAKADEEARSAEAEMFAVLERSPDVPAHLRNQATALRGIANRLLDDAMGSMRLEADPPRKHSLRWPFIAAA